MTEKRERSSPKAAWKRSFIAVGILVLLGLAYMRWFDRSGGEHTATLLLQNPLDYDAPADRCTPDLCAPLVALIDDAQSTIDFAIYGARHQSAILEALQRAQRRGVTVRGYIDRDEHGDNYYSSTPEWVQKLSSIRDDQRRETRCREDIRATPLTCPRPPGFSGPMQCTAFRSKDRLILAPHASREALQQSNKIMHHKFFVVDQTHVWTGSSNISDSGTGGYNANVALMLDSEEAAAAYSREFETLWNRDRSNSCTKPPRNAKPFRVGDAHISVRFSPQDSASRRGVVPLIAKAKREINVAVFFLTSKQLAANLIAAHDRGVRVRIIIDATAATNGYTKHEVLRQAGIPVKVENWGGKMHSKAASVDGQFLIAGSMNWTSAGEWANDENTLLIRSRRLAGEFDDYFETIWESIPDPWQQAGTRPDPESWDSGTACTDRVDNDFDDLIDQEDPGCSTAPPALLPLPPLYSMPYAERRSVDGVYQLWWPSRCTASAPWYRCK